MSNLSKCVLGAAMLLVCAAAGFADEPTAPATSLAGEPGAQGADAKDVKAIFQRIIEKRQFDVIDSLGKAKAYGFVLDMQTLGLRTVVVREGVKYRAYVRLRDDLVLVASNDGSTIVGESGGKPVLKVSKDSGYQLAIEASDTEISYSQELTNDEKAKGQLKLALTGVLAGHAKKYDQVWLKQEGDALVIRSRGTQTSIIARYDLKKDQPVGFYLFDADGKLMMGVGGFTELAPGQLDAKLRLPEAGRVIEDVPVEAADGVVGFTKMVATFGQMAVRKDRKVAGEGSVAMTVFYWREVIGNLRISNRGYLSEQTAQLREEGARKPEQAGAFIRQTGARWRTAHMTGDLNKSEREALRGILFHEGVVATPDLVLDRQLMLADLFLTPAGMGIKPEEITALDALLYRFLQGAPGHTPAGQESAYTETDASPGWAQLMGRIESGALGKMTSDDRRAMVETGLWQLKTRDIYFLSLARVFSNLFKDPGVRVAVEELIDAKVKKGDVAGAEKLLSLVLSEDADKANREWVRGLKTSTLKLLKGQPLTPESVQMTGAIRTHLGLAAGTNAVLAMSLREDPLGLVKKGENGKPDIITYTLPALTGKSHELIVDVLGSANGNTLGALTLLGVGLNASVPWKWQREYYRKLGVTLENEPDNPRVAAWALVMLIQGEAMSREFVAQALPGVQAYCLKAKTPFWEDGLRVLYGPGDRAALLTATEAKTVKEALKVLEDKAFVSAHVERLKELAKMAKVEPADEWIEPAAQKKAQ